MQGFSLVELMVAVVISLILTAGMSQIFLSSKKSFIIQDSLGRQQENGRYAIGTITADLRRAGYWGGNARIEAVTGSLGSVADNGSCPDNPGNTTWGRMIDRRISGLNDTRAGYACIPTEGTTGKYLRGDVLTVRFAAPWTIGGATTPDFKNNRLYLRSDLFNGRIFQGKDQGLPDNAISTPPAFSERESELLARAYYIGDSGRRCSNGAPIPSLFRQTLGPGGTPVTEEVAYGVDHFQVRYGVDTDGDGAVDRYFNAGDDGLDDTTGWNQVIAARIWVLTRSECPETGFTHPDTLDYDMGDIRYDPPDTANFGYRRQLYQNTVRLRNALPVKSDADNTRITH